MLTFPTLQGLTWGCKASPSFSTAIARAATGREVAFPLQSSVLWDFDLSYEFLRGNNSVQQAPTAPAYSDFDTIAGFFCQVQGRAQTFLFPYSLYTRNPNDGVLNGQKIGTGNGSAVSFQVTRSYGGYNEPLQSPTVTAVMVNGTVVSSSTYSITNGLITFTSAPANNAIITINGVWQYACRFTDDDLDFEGFMYELYELQSVKLHQVKL